MRKLRSRRVLAAFCVLALSFWAYQSYLFAIPYNQGTYNSCQYSSCSISIGASNTVSLSVSPTTSGSYSTTSDSVTVTTGASTGYTLTLADGDTTTSLVSGSNNIAASTGTQSSPIVRSMNSWGYRVDGLGGFGSGPTGVESNASSSSFTFAGVPSSTSTADTLKTTSTAASGGDSTTIWYGVAANISQPSGTYTDIVVYTATVN